MNGNGRLSVRDVQSLERMLGGDPVTEVQIVEFIRAKWGARNLFDLPRNVAVAALHRPADFIRAAKRYCEPELF